MFPPPPGRPPRPPLSAGDPEQPREAPLLAKMNLSADEEAKKPAHRRESTTPGSLRWRSTLTVLCLLAYVPVGLYSAFTVSAYLTNREQPSKDLLDRISLMTDVYAASFVLVGASFCVWLWKMVKAVRRMGANIDTSSPNLAVASFFVPPFCFWKPYVIVRAVWQSAIDPRDGDNIPATQILPLWWMAWITQWIAIVMFLVFEYLMLGVPQKPMLEIVDVWIFFGCGVLAALCLVIIVIQATRNMNLYLRGD